MPSPVQIEKLADDLLLHLRKKPKKFYSKEKLAKTFQADSSRIEKALLTIEKWGYLLNWRPPTEVAFVSAPDHLTATEISYSLISDLFREKIISFGEVKSTNDIAMQSAEKGAAEGTIITADSQTAGRGRLGRTWHSTPGKGIYLSIILRPNFPPAKAPGLSLMTALALARTLKSFKVKNVKVKWPNDLLIDGKKVAGILTELSAERGKIAYLVVGAGINVNHDLKDFPGQISKLATSIRLATGKSVARVTLLQEFLKQFETLYKLYKINFLTSMLDDLRNYSLLIGCDVELLSGRETIKGKAVDIDSDGRLIVECDGKKVKVNSGEVTLISRNAPRN